MTTIRQLQILAVVLVLAVVAGVILAGIVTRQTPKPLPPYYPRPEVIVTSPMTRPVYNAGGITVCDMRSAINCVIAIDGGDTTLANIGIRDKQTYNYFITQDSVPRKVFYPKYMQATVDVPAIASARFMFACTADKGLMLCGIPIIYGQK